ncbi:MAG: holin-associated N-acetylmuramidase [Minwuia sp.]|nr:holin-associated N-acetylmuramidase [Minwuia sp.]
MSNCIEAMARHIVEREGGYVDHPNDPGGATKYGVTIHTMRRLGLDLDGDGDVDAADVRLVTVERAVGLFIDRYYQKPGIWRLPEPLQPAVFDMQVNAGSHAGRLLQAVLNRACNADLATDGIIGPGTASAAERAYQAMGDLLVDAYAIERRDYYYRIADRRPKLRAFARRRDGGKGGWIRRAEEFMSAQFHYTARQHHERTAAWA